MAVESKSGPMDQNTKVFGKMIRPKGEVDSLTAMATSTKANGKMIKPTGTAHIFTSQARHIKANGVMISSMDSVCKDGKMELIIMEITNSGRNTGEVNSFGLMVQNLKETFMKMGYRAREFISGRTEDSIQVSGLIIRCMEMEYLYGQMGEGIGGVI